MVIKSIFLCQREVFNLIYTRDNYERTFQNDLITAKYSVVIAISKIRYKRKLLIVETLGSLLHKGRGRSVRIKEAGYNEIDLSDIDRNRGYPQ